GPYPAGPNLRRRQSLLFLTDDQPFPRIRFTSVEAKPVELAGRRIADDVRDDHLAPFAVRASDHRDFAHAGVPEQHLLDFARIDVGAAADDDVLGSILEREVAVGIERAEIAGMQPAVAHRAG